MRPALLLAALLMTAPVRADSTTVWKPPAPPRHRKLGVALLAGGGACLALGGMFVALAAKANGDALADMKYHPASVDQRDAFQIADGAMFVIGGVALVSGLVLLW